MSDDSGFTVPVEPATQTPKQQRFVWTPRLVIWTVLVVALLLFVLQNFDDKQINVLFWDFTPPLALIVIICFLIGYLLGWLRPKFRPHRNS